MYDTPVNIALQNNINQDVYHLYDNSNFSLIDLGVLIIIVIVIIIIIELISRFK